MNWSLPARYETDVWDVRFKQRLTGLLEPGIRILDLGAGARPALPAAERPAGSHYAGLDISADELGKAPSGSYDEVIVGDVISWMPELEGRFDLILSWLVMEHVKPLDVAFANLRTYLRPGGTLLAQLSGAFSLHALLNRVIPGPMARRLLRRTQGREPDTVFPAHYHLGWYSALERTLGPGWRSHEVIPLFTGARYLDFSPLLRAVYLAYEDVAYRANWRNLAAYYLVVAQADGAPLGAEPRPPAPESS
jgi:SAM-dependent methyltransferase